MTLNVYIDSDVMVASEIKEEKNHIESKKFMDYVLQSKSDIRFFTSVFTFLELASAMIRRTKKQDKAYSLLYRVRNSWKRFIHPLAPRKKITSFTDFIDNLIETCIKFKTPAGDTIHAHTFAENDMNYFITWNTKHFNGMRNKIKGIKILTPTDVLREFNKTKKEGVKEPNKILEETWKRLMKSERNVLIRVGKGSLTLKPKKLNVN